MKDDPDRAARLAAALRANLRRRKAQERAVEAGGASSVPAIEHAGTSPAERPEE